MRLFQCNKERYCTDKEEDGKFVEANNNEIAKAMTISHKDNDMKYMDITEKCQCRNLKLTNC